MVTFSRVVYTWYQVRSAEKPGCSEELWFPYVLTKMFESVASDVAALAGAAMPTRLPTAIARTVNRPTRRDLSMGNPSN
jgi:hypothetical protein